MTVAGTVEKAGLYILNSAYVIVGPVSGFRSVNALLPARKMSARSTKVNRL